ncbi:MAG: CotH kinase family protein [Eubacteriales bacterium]|nr:CotH kinase family protein [Eubacteriales bacterium]MDD3882964.1 CotH kinase family protein [Eubacteriales bacterium]MDD4513489.1 CotH kinase family protein [Eubacteriales bacterium]
MCGAKLRPRCVSLLMKSLLLAFAAFALFVIVKPSCALAVSLSEVCSQNKTAYKAENGAYPDYIELYNPDDFYVDLDGWFISDDSEQPFMAALDGRGIEAGGYILLYADDSDLPFKLSSAGETLLLSSPDGAEDVLVKIPLLAQDEVFSLSSDGTYGISSPTPLAENIDAAPYSAAPIVISPRLSKGAGFYDEPFYLELSAPEGETIYYTLDGSEPDASSIAYANPIFIDDASYHMNKNSARTDISVLPVKAPESLQVKGTVVRAAAIDEFGNRSSIVTGTYFIGFQNRREYAGLPVMSIAVSPELMFGEDDGIYMLGHRYKDWLASAEYSPDTAVNSIPSNYRMHGLEIPACVEWFDESGNLSLDETLGLRIHGNFSRHDAQKSLKLYARSAYGDDKIEYKFWDDVGKNKRIVVRSGGNNHVLMCLDVFAHRLLSQRGLPYSRSLPCLVYINGEFWGLYNIRESQDEDYIAENYGVSDDDVIMIKNQALQEGLPSDLEDYKAMLKTIAETICVTDESYEYVGSLIDIDSYTNYLAGGICIQCVDWLNINNNSTLWRTRQKGGEGYYDGRWRWIYQDLDYSCGWGQSDPTPVQLLLKEPIFSALWTNEKYRVKFLTTVMDIANIDCAMPRVSALWDELSAVYRQYNTLNYSRFSQDYSLDSCDAQVKNVKDFFAERPEKLARELTDALKLSSAHYTLTVDYDGASVPLISVNGSAIQLSRGEWSGIYFSSCPITVSAGEMIGYDFAGWYEKNKLVYADSQITVNLSGNRTLTPVYTRRDEIMAIASDMPALENDGSVSLAVNQYSYGAAARLDEGLSASVSDGSVRIASDEKWRKNQGFEIGFDSAGYDSLVLEMELYASAEAPKEWRILAGQDGAALSEAGESFKLTEGANIVRVSLPSAASDSYSALLRMEAAKKSGGEASITIKALCLYGNEKEVPAAGLRRAAELCSSIMGSEFAAPTEEEIAGYSAYDVNERTKEMYKRLASFTARKGMREIGSADIAANPLLEGLGGEKMLELSGEAGIYSSEIDIGVGIDGELYAYRLSADSLALFGIFETENGELTLPSDSGTYVLLRKPVEQYRYKAEAFLREMDASLLSVIGGEVNEPFAWLKIDRLTAYQESMRFDLSAFDGISGRTVRIYSVSESALELMERVRPDGDGVYSVSPLDSGEYLILLSSPEHYRYEAESGKVASENSAGSAVKAPASVPLPAVAAIGAALLLLAVFLIARKRRKR